MTIEHSIQFYQQHLSEEEIERCRKKAVRETTLEEAVEQGMTYMELQQSKYMHEVVEFYREILERTDEKLNGLC